ncbi:hypothetical protein ABM187_003624 [Stenotrophomonas maltophilia]|uniref:hypothetical protein n=1 Tax=Stenotrophomonas maltophilia TaxID=40324 RepID=UPI0013121283|nr:hypothetical protein [Stenotrophomonas maltophilia]HDS1522166.1 hypothetical protein [Stenotrophomonas maltophilia]HDS1622437.1 hypothetical protein [Stenotrophomonas maltophilia]HDS1657204.1 hypothetical protein [Stenotrophomonas maltophilia]HDS1671222.1 hypothetical protein [Stenotrophomonas maltophilia]
MLKLKKVAIVCRQVKLRLPTDTPDAFNEGTITVGVKILTKEKLKDLADADLHDTEYLRQILVSVSGLGDEDGNPVEGDAALAEVYNGPWSTYLQNAILQDYWEQYGEVRVKNSKPSRGR